MTQKSGIVSVYIPTRNRAPLLMRALNSVLGQSYPDLEILVVDDASSDETPGLMAPLAQEGKIRYFRFHTQQGAPAARNFALAHAQGELVTGIDDDDIWLPHRVAELVSHLDGSVGFVAASDVVWFSEDTCFIARRPACITHAALLQRNVVGNQVLARRRDVIDCGGFDQSLAASQDYDLWIRLSAHAGAGVGLFEPLQVIQAQLDRSRITTSKKRRTGVWRVYRNHVSHMTRRQRKLHLFNLIRTTERHISLRTAGALLDVRNIPRLFIHLVRSRGWAVDRLLERTATRRDRAEVERILKQLAAPIDH